MVDVIRFLSKVVVMASMSNVVQRAVVKSLTVLIDVEINADAVRVLVTSHLAHIEIVNL